MPSQSLMPSAQTNVIDGRAIAAQIQRELAQRVAELKKRGVHPGLAFVRVGEDPASKVYVGRKEKACAELGIFSETHVLPEATSESGLARVDGKTERRFAPARNSGPSAAAEAYPRAGYLFRRFAAKGRGRISSGQRRQIDARRRDWLSALHAGGHRASCSRARA